MGNKGSKKKQTIGAFRSSEIATLKANSKLSEIEIQEMYEEFNQDAGSSTGRMNKEQFRKYYNRVANDMDKDGTLVDNIFAMFDTNHDGSIDFSEFVLVAAAQNRNDLDTLLELSFAKIDLSGDECISYDELVDFIDKAITVAVGQKKATAVDAKEVATDIYKKLGLDQTQKLNRQQFVDGCKKHRHLIDIFAAT